MADKPTEIAKEMQKQYGFLTVAQFEIKSLEIGKRQEAATVLFKTRRHPYRKAWWNQENLGYILRAWKDIKASALLRWRLFHSEESSLT